MSLAGLFRPSTLLAVTSSLVRSEMLRFLTHAGLPGMSIARARRGKRVSGTFLAVKRLRRMESMTTAFEARIVAA